MPQYQRYDPMTASKQRREAAVKRLMAVAEARRRFTKEMYDKQQADLAAQEAEQAEMDREGKMNIGGNALSGAMEGGAVGGPWGALVGGVAGLIGGGLEKASQLKSEGKSTWEIATGSKGIKGVGSLLNPIGPITGRGLVHDVGSGGLAGTYDQYNRGKFKAEYMQPGSQYAKSPGAALIGSLAGRMADKSEKKRDREESLQRLAELQRSRAELQRSRSDYYTPPPRARMGR